jgi:hypothetical protein
MVICLYSYDVLMKNELSYEISLVYEYGMYACMYNLIVI